MIASNAQTLGGLFDDVSAQRDDNTFLVFKDERYTYRQMHELSDAIAKGLLALGYEKGDHIALWVGNHPMWIAFQQAIYKIGASLVTVNTHNLVDETEYVLWQSDAVAVIVQEQFLKTDFMGMLHEMAPELPDCEPGHLKAERLPALRTVITFGGEKYPGTMTYDELIELGKQISDEQLAERANSVDPDSVALIIYTSGTTGRPKGAMITHRAIIARMQSFADWFEFTENDSTLFSLPLFYIFGAVIAIQGTITAGSKLCLLETFDSSQGLQMIEREKCNIIHGVPTIFYGLLQDPDFDKYDVSSGSTGVMGGAPSPLPLTQEIHDKLLPNVCSVWGLTESSTMVTSTRLHDSLELVSTTVGVAMPGSEVVILDPETYEELPDGEEGEVCIISPYNMIGYYNNPEATAETIDEQGRLHTGDQAVISPETGYMTIRGRIKDMIIVGGSNVYPAEIENELCAFEGVAEAQVVGIPDERLGELPVAFIKKEAGAEVDPDALIEHCKEHLANYKIPRRVIFIDEFPLTISGKVKKYELRDMAQESQ